MKLIDADKGYEVLDGLFSAIQKNNYAATQQMLDEAWEKWCGIPAAYDVGKVVGQLELLLDNAEYDDLNTYEEKAAYSHAYSKSIEAVKEGWVNG